MKCYGGKSIRKKKKIYIYIYIYIYIWFTHSISSVHLSYDKITQKPIQFLMSQQTTLHLRYDKIKVKLH